MVTRKLREEQPLAKAVTSAVRAAEAEVGAIDVLARTLWGEARSEGKVGMEAVANVIMNRVRHPRRWPDDVRGVVKQRLQFSAWNAGDPNRARMLRVTEADREFRQALEIARRAVAGTLKDRTKGADHFHTAAVTPAWSRGRTPVATIGRHRFFRLEPI